MPKTRKEWLMWFGAHMDELDRTIIVKGKPVKAWFYFRRLYNIAANGEDCGREINWATLRSVTYKGPLVA